MDKFTDAQVRAAARMKWATNANDELEIEQGAFVSESGDDGFWVAAYVYVNKEDIR